MLKRPHHFSKTKMNLASLMETAENNFTKCLVGENACGRSQFECRQVFKAHYSLCKPEKVPLPSLICYSQKCFNDLGLFPSEIVNAEFINIFSGNTHATGNNITTGWNQSFASVYGCHSYAQWFGQLGDGRAVILGDVKVPLNTYEMTNNIDFQSYEVQLKGSGRTPYSRWGDGRAVLRSCIRELLASESMHYMGVPTTRALCVVTTGQGIRRNWYRERTSTPKNSTKSTSEISRTTQRFPPDRPMIEPGAIMTRIAPVSFVRVGQLELFAKRNDFENCKLLADYVVDSEYPSLSHDTATGFAADNHKSTFLKVAEADKYVNLFRCIVKKCAFLVAQWMRVGYVQGNMNTDNLLIGGRTIDYGPFGFLEVYDPGYQPFTSDRDGHFSYIEQPTAMQVNMTVLGMDTFSFLVMKVVDQTFALSTNANPGEADGESDVLLEETKEYYSARIKEVYDEFYLDAFNAEYNDVKMNKLGIMNREMDSKLYSQLYQDLLKLMHQSQCDFTMMFRCLSQIAQILNKYRDRSDCSPGEQLISFGTIADSNGIEEIVDPCYNLIKESMLNPNLLDEVALRTQWSEWLAAYARIIALDNYTCQPCGENGNWKKMMVARERLQNASNPKYVFRNWMGALAYEEMAVLDAKARSLHEELDSTLGSASGYDSGSDTSSCTSSDTSSGNSNIGTSVFEFKGIPKSVPAEISMGLFQDSVCKEILDVLTDPYEKEPVAPEIASKYYRPTPEWAVGMPGVAFMS